MIIIKFFYTLLMTQSMASVTGDSRVKNGINMKESNTLVSNIFALLSCAAFRSKVNTIMRKPVKSQKVLFWMWMYCLKEQSPSIIANFLIIHKEWSREMSKMLT